MQFNISYTSSTIFLHMNKLRRTDLLSFAGCLYEPRIIKVWND